MFLYISINYIKVSVTAIWNVHMVLAHEDYITMNCYHSQKMSVVITLNKVILHQRNTS